MGIPPRNTKLITEDEFSDLDSNDTFANEYEQPTITIHILIYSPRPINNPQKILEQLAIKITKMQGEIIDETEPTQILIHKQFSALEGFISTTIQDLLNKIPDPTDHAIYHCTLKLEYDNNTQKILKQLTKITQTSNINIITNSERILKTLEAHGI